MSISCIIPTLCRREVVCDTVEMLLGQSRPAEQIVVVDQTPEESEVTSGRLEMWSRERKILLLKQREANASRARNAGALAASGDYLLFLDDDIQIGPDFIAAYAETLAGSGAPGVSGPVLEGRRTLTEKLPEGTLTSELGWLLRFRKNYGRVCETSFMMSGNVAIRRDLFLKLGGMDENYEQGAHREESDFAMRFRAAGYRFHYDPRCKVFHLGPERVPGGGARAGAKGREFWYFHHCVGDWYFNLKFCGTRTLAQLLGASLRHFVFNRQTLERPWRMPLALGFWLLGLPPAAVKRWRGAKLLGTIGAQGERER